MRKRTLFVYPNPYAHIDANGRLAGATPIGEMPRSTSVMPAREFVGATRELLELDTKDRGPTLAQQSRAEYRFVWKDESVEVDASGQLNAFWLQRAKEGEVFILGADKKVPLEKLAAARQAAIAQYRAEQSHEAPVMGPDGAPMAGTGCPVHAPADGEKPAKSCKCITDPDATEWAKQFPLDEDVAHAAELLEAKRIADEVAAKAKAEADEKKAADTKASDAKAEADAKKAAEERRARVTKALGLPLGPSPNAGAPATGGGPGTPSAPAPAIADASSVASAAPVPRRPPSVSPTDPTKES